MRVEDLTFDREALARLCQRLGVRRLEVFGSFARGDARPDSDIDLLVDLPEGAAPGMDYLQFAVDLEHILGRRIDLIERHIVEREQARPIFRREVLRHARSIYGPAAA